MIPRVRTAVDVKKAIDKAGRKLTEIGFDASVLKDGYNEIQDTLKSYTRQFLTPGPDENTLVVPGGGEIDMTQMVCHLSNYRVYV